MEFTLLETILRFVTAPTKVFSSVNRHELKLNLKFLHFCT